MKPSILDKAISIFSPALAAQRLEQREIYQLWASGAYSAAEDTRYRTNYAFNRAMYGSEDKLVGPYDRTRIRLECRDLWRNNEIVRGAVDRFGDYAVWNGIYPQAQSSSKDWNNEVEAFWARYMQTADYRQIPGSNLINLQQLIISNRILDGDCGFIMLENGQVQPIEADRIATPQNQLKDKNIIEGVRRSDEGLVLGFYICDRSNDGAIDNTKSNYIPRENFIFCYKPVRFDQLRGIPDLAPAVNKLRDYDETDLNVLNKVKLDALQQFKRTTQTGLPNAMPRNSYRLTDASGKNPTIVEKNEFGQTINLRAGEDMIAFESKTPNQQYVEYMKHELQTVASCLNISYEILMLIFTEGSFSSQRAALIHNRHTFLQWHNWVVKCFMDRLWNWRVAKAMKAGEISKAPVTNGISEWFKKSWSLPYFDWVDPQNQAQADKDRYNMGSISLKTITASMGTDRDDVLSDKQDDIREAMKLADGLRKEFPNENITWRDLINTSTPGAITGAQSQPPAKETPAKKEAI